MKIDDIADLAATHNAIEIVDSNGVSKTRGEIADTSAPLQPCGDVAFHEYGAALAKPRRSRRSKCFSGEFVLDQNAEALCLLFEKRTGSGGASFIHCEIHHDTIFDGDELGVLATDFEYRVHITNFFRWLAVGVMWRGMAADEFLVDKDRTGFMRGDFVVDGIRANKLANQFAARAGSTNASDKKSITEAPSDFLQAVLNNFDGATGSAEIDSMKQPAMFVKESEVGADGANINPKISRNRVAIVRN